MKTPKAIILNHNLKVKLVFIENFYFRKGMSAGKLEHQKYYYIKLSDVI